MAYTDKDEADLKAIASGKAGYFSDEYGRQFKGKKREADAKPKRPGLGGANPANEPAIKEAGYKKGGPVSKGPMKRAPAPAKKSSASKFCW
jgi:hypothetical protein